MAANLGFDRRSVMADHSADSLPRPKGGARGNGVALWGILALLALYSLYFARDILAPIAIAGMAGMMLSPVVGRLRRMGVPRSLGAALMVGLVLGALGWGIHALGAPAGEWMRKVPESVANIERKIRDFQWSLRMLQQATKEVEKLAHVGAPSEPSAPVVSVTERSLTRIVLSGTSLVLAQIGVVIILVYFLLATGDVLMARLVAAFSKDSDRRRLVDIAEAVRHDVTVYLGTVALINLGLGAATAAGMAAIGMPNPLLWGVMAALLNFIPYAGAWITTIVVTVVGLLSFDTLARAMLAPALFQIFANMEANLVTPALLGRSLALNPLLVFLSLVLWSWIWGIPGAFLAVPFLVTAKIFADHWAALDGLSIFLGRPKTPSED
jgi:predicted PurR-regulated permease PerM